MKKSRFAPALVLLAALSLVLACTSGPAQAGPADARQPAVADKPLNLTILHVNDTHSKFDASLTRLSVDINAGLKARGVYLELGGFPHLASLVDTARARAGASLFLHGGDLFQGTLYFTKFEGAADTDFFNLMKLDAATLGNHEFDRGPDTLNRNLLTAARFSLVDANVDISKEGLIPDKSRLPPYVIKEIGGTKIGLIGLTTTDTVHISSPGKFIAFLDAASAVRKAAAELAGRNVNKIILISHQGYFEDIKLAAALSHVDVIVGGHSHTLVGDFSKVGLNGAGPYPTVAVDMDGKKVLVVQAWEWAKQFGQLEVNFDAAGLVTGWKADPRLVAGNAFMRVYDVPNLKGEVKRVQYSPASAAKPAISEFDGKNWVAVADDPASAVDQYDAYKAVQADLLKALAASPVSLVDAQPAAAEKLAFYGKGVNELRGQVAANAGEDLIRGLNSGSGQIVADGMRIKTGTRIALNNPGGVRTDINQGPISVAAVYELLPFNNTLVTVELKGADVIKAIEDVVDFQIGRYGADPKAAILYVSGVKFSLKMAAPKSERIRDVLVLEADGNYKAIQPAASYPCVVNNYMAAGGDKNDTLKAIGGKYDTRFNDAEAFLEYIKDRTLRNMEERIKLVN
jgi:5'-nucleotidase / UDP-sugar diphosphatase